MPDRVTTRTIAFVCLLIFSALLGACVPVPNQAPSATGARLSGVVTYGGQPAAGARVTLRSPGWQADPAGMTVAAATAGPDGIFVMENPPAGDFSVIGVFPDGEEDQGGWPPVTIAPGQSITDLVVPLERALTLVEPAADCLTNAVPVLRWAPFAGVKPTDGYRVLLIDAGTTELLLDQTLSQTELAAPVLSPGRSYTWVVNAYGPNDILLAAGERAFTVASDACAPTPTPE